MKDLTIARTTSPDVALQSRSVGDIPIRIINKKHKVIASCVVAVGLDIVIDLFSQTLAVGSIPDIFSLNYEPANLRHEVLDRISIRYFVSRILGH